MENPAARLAIATALFGQVEEGGFVKCPGQHLHTGRTARKDCRVLLDKAPSLYCLHSNCAALIEENNLTLRRRIAAAEREGGDKEKPLTGLEGCAAPPQPAPLPKIPQYSPAKLELLARQCRKEITLDWLAERSPVRVPSVVEQRRDGRACSRLFLNSIYRPGEKALVFTRFFSQGDFIAEAGGNSYRLADKPGVPAVPSALPKGGREGVWFLTAPVTGEWAKMSGVEGRMGRRHEACATGFRFALLESDKAPERAWLKALAVVPLPIAAIYTSGGVSVHALLRVDCAAKAEFDQVRDVLRAVLCPAGADGAALTAIRLSRLPGCLRFGKQAADGFKPYAEPALQRLVYLNPEAPLVPLIDILK